ncbi:hypothetical protein HanRHA438_Chr10g0474121 [Helianthus annuus]|nr:hypothetical protein HanRHA438_Chr10g0474121 [Helianthus annuus]
MEVMKSFSSDLGVSRKTMAAFSEFLVAARVSLACAVMMTGFLLQGEHTLQTLIGNDQRFPIYELNKKSKTEPEAKDGSDTEDDDDDDEAEEPEDDDEDGDEDDDEDGDEDDDEDEEEEEDDDEEEEPPAKKRK